MNLGSLTRYSLLVLFALSSHSFASSSEDQAYKWLTLMNQSIRSLDYRGTFVHQIGNSIQAMELLHKAGDVGEFELLKSLNGKPVEVIRHKGHVILKHQGSEKMTVQRFSSQRKLSSLIPLVPDNLKNFYQLQLGGEDRVAGRIGKVIRIVPKDDLRFGYQLVLDKEYALPLDTQMLDFEQNTLSRMMFTHFEIGEVEWPQLPNLDGGKISSGLERSYDNATAQKKERLEIFSYSRWL